METNLFTHIYSVPSNKKRLTRYCGEGNHPSASDMYRRNKLLPINPTIGAERGLRGVCGAGRGGRGVVDRSHFPRIEWKEVFRELPERGGDGKVGSRGKPWRRFAEAAARDGGWARTSQSRRQAYQLRVDR